MAELPVAVDGIYCNCLFIGAAAGFTEKSAPSLLKDPVTGCGHQERRDEQGDGVDLPAGF